MGLKNIGIRYGISTLGVILAALGVGVSIKSNLGIAPMACPPTISNLYWNHISVGTFTWLVNMVFMLIQLAILRKNFKARYLMQIPATLLFGYLCDVSIWLFDSIGSPATEYPVQLLLSLAAVVLTAIGIKLEVIGKGWILSGDLALAVISDATHKPFGTWKVILDVVLVTLTAVFAWFAFGILTGNGQTVVIREGTLILAILTGLCMRVTDPLIEKWVGPVVPEQ